MPEIDAAVCSSGINTSDITPVRRRGCYVANPITGIRAQDIRERFCGASIHTDLPSRAICTVGHVIPGAATEHGVSSDGTVDTTVCLSSRHRKVITARYLANIDSPKSRIRAAIAKHDAVHIQGTYFHPGADCSRRR